jgi:methionyl-tRNA synthetase
VDAVRYYISVAGPENQDSDFTWKEFVRHNNEELVSGWGNLVNRVATLLFKNFGEIPATGKRAKIDADLLDETSTAFDTVGDLIEHHHQKAALNEAMRVVGEINKYISATEPWKLKEDRDRLTTVLNTAAQAVNDANLLLAPFLPHSSQKVHEALGGKGTIAPLPELKDVEDLDKQGFTYPIITGKYELGVNVAPWKRAEVVAGTPIAKPSPLFEKIAPEAVAEETERIEAEIAARQNAEKQRLNEEKAKLAGDSED